MAANFLSSPGTACVALRRVSEKRKGGTESEWAPIFQSLLCVCACGGVRSRCLRSLIKPVRAGRSEAHFFSVFRFKRKVSHERRENESSGRGIDLALDAPDRPATPPGTGTTASDSAPLRRVTHAVLVPLSHTPSLQPGHEPKDDAFALLQPGSPPVLIRGSGAGNGCGRGMQGVV